MTQSWFTLGSQLISVITLMYKKKNNESMGKHMEIVDAENNNVTSDDENESDDTLKIFPTL